MRKCEIYTKKVGTSVASVRFTHVTSCVKKKQPKYLSKKKQIFIPFFFEMFSFPGTPWGPLLSTNFYFDYDVSSHLPHV